MGNPLEGLRRIAATVKRAPTRAETPRPAWATVSTAGTVPTVILDDDEAQVPRPVSANAAGALQAGWRVRVELQGRRITIVSAPQQVAALQTRIATLERKASGAVTVSVNASAGGSATVAFPTGLFMSADTLDISLTKLSGGLAKYVPYATVISATGMTVGLYSGDGSTGTGSVPINWTVSVRRT